MKCTHRSTHFRRPMPHVFTSRMRLRVPGGEWSDWKTVCSWCEKEKV